MAAPATVTIGALLFVASALGQHLATAPSSRPAGICPSIYAPATVYTLNRLRGCVVILGNLRVVWMETANASSFQNYVFPDLREVTGFVAIYRVRGLVSVGQLFPNLTRIRGEQLINNYALIVHDMTELRDVGLNSLLKIDRGGVVISGGPHTCYIDTIDWEAIAPRSRHMLTYPEMTAHCKTVKPCKCKKERNFCWNSKACQRFDTPNICHSECLGCARNRPEECSVCRHHTYRGICVRECPDNTILLPENQYCITEAECQALNGWRWRNRCIFECPVGYKKVEIVNTITCEVCFNCQKTCPSLTIDNLSSIQKADRCVIISGSLTVHVKSVPGAVQELRKYLKLIEVVADYIYISGAHNITSLDFLPSLRQIVGRNLKDKEYSLIIQEMKNLRNTFTPKVMEQLQIDRGKLKILNNPMLCMSKVEELKRKFKLPSNDTEIPPSLNGYSGGCEDHLKLRVEIISETSATVKFTPKNGSIEQYTVLYAKVPSESRAVLLPETCSNSEWFAIHTRANETEILLSSLSPASTYVVCIETFTYSKDNLLNNIARTSVINFTMPFSKPPPPFIQELVATSPNAVGLRWLDHKDYRPHITNYQLDITLVHILTKDLKLKDHCYNHNEFYAKEDYSRHVRVFKPPAEYEICATTCLTLTSHLKEVPIEDDFDLCDSFEFDCNVYEEDRPKNASFKKYVKSLSLDINEYKSIFHVKGLAPYRDYKLRLRSCAKQKCSRSSRGVIRTLRSNTADIPSKVNCSVNETGHILVKWEPPDETNGPVLAYYIQVLSGDALNQSLPDVWCQYPNDRSFVVRSPVAKEFRVRVCTSSLGSYNACSNWQRVGLPELESGLWWKSILIVLSVILFLIFVAIRFFFRRRKKAIDAVPLVDLTSMHRNESDPPAVMFTDFMPLYTVPLNEALLE